MFGRTKLHWANLTGLESFPSLGDFELNLLVFSKGFETITLNFTEVRKQVITAI